MQGSWTRCTLTRLLAHGRGHLTELSMIVSWIRLPRQRVDLGLALGIALIRVGLLALFLAMPGSQLRGPVTSTLRNPFTDSHAISTLTDVHVNDLDEVGMTTYQSEDTGGWL